MPGSERFDKIFRGIDYSFAKSAFRHYTEKEIMSAMNSSIQEAGFLDRYDYPAVAIAGFTPNELIIVLYRWNPVREAYLVYHAEKATDAKRKQWFG